MTLAALLCHDCHRITFYRFDEIKVPVLPKCICGAVSTELIGTIEARQLTSTRTR